MQFWKIKWELKSVLWIKVNMYVTEDHAEPVRIKPEACHFLITAQFINYGNFHFLKNLICKFILFFQAFVVKCSKR